MGLHVQEHADHTTLPPSRHPIASPPISSHFDRVRVIVPALHGYTARRAVLSLSYLASDNAHRTAPQRATHLHDVLTPRWLSLSSQCSECGSGECVSVGACSWRNYTMGRFINASLRRSQWSTVMQPQRRVRHSPLTLPRSLHARS